MKVLLCTPYLESPDVVSSGIGTWARNIMAYNRETGSNIEIVPVSFDRHTHIEEYTVRGFKRYYSGIKEVGSCLIKAIRKIKTEKPDLIHVCTSGSFGFIKDILLSRVAHRRGIKSVVHFHFGRVPSVLEEKGFEYRLLKKLLGIADTILVIDGKSFKALTDLNYKNIAYVPNPVSNTFLQELRRQEHTAVRKEKAAVFVGHVVTTKGVVEAVESCREIPGLTLRIIGRCSDSELKERLCSMAQERENGNWLQVVGEIPHKEVIGELLKAGIFVFPSYTEAFPNVILEAMACGCAIVTTSVGAIPEMLNMDSDEPCGYCCEPQEVAGLRDHIKYLMDHPSEARQLAERSVKRVNERFTSQIVWNQLVEIWS